MAARDAAGLRPLRFHDLRHTYGSLLASGGVPVTDIQSAMGHADVQTTARYLHARQAGEQVEGITRDKHARRLGGCSGGRTGRESSRQQRASSIPCDKALRGARDAVQSNPAGRLVRQPPIGVARRRRPTLLSWALRRPRCPLR
jgi:Phage integrase family